MTGFNEDDTISYGITKLLIFHSALYTSLCPIHLQDRFAFQQALPPIDPSQDWFLVRGMEDGGYTILEFTRNWTTCDDRDRDIEVCTVQIYRTHL